MTLKVTAREQSKDSVDIRAEMELNCRMTIWGLFDAHVDNAKCDLPLLKSEIAEMAADPDARVIIGGDFNDLMFALGDYRQLPSGLGSRLHGVDDKISEIVRWNVELLEPIKDKIDCFIYGNHESSYEKRHGVNVSALTVERLNALRGDSPPIHFAGYGTWVRYFITVPKLKKSAVSKGWVHHGSGGDAPVTKGMINVTRTQTDFPYFDWHMSGHIHKATANNSPALDVYGGFGQGKLVARDRVAVVCGTYERNYPMGKKSTFSMEKRHSPAPLGAGKIYLTPKLRKDRPSTLYLKASFQ